MENIVAPPHSLSDSVIIGKIGGVYGVRGWVKIISFTDKLDNIFHYDPWFILFKKQWKLIRLESWKALKRQYIAKIFGISNREMAMLLINSNLIINRLQLPVLCNNEYYWKDIVGCKVLTIQGNSLGYVDYIIETSVYDILVIKIDKKKVIKKTNYFIPFIQNKIIKCVNLVENIIVVDWHYNF